MASYSLYNETKLIVVQSVFPAIGFTALSLVGLDPKFFVFFLEVVLILHVMKVDPDEIHTMPIAHLLTRLLLTTLLYLGTNMAAHSLIEEYELSEAKFRMSESWAAWGVTAGLQYGHMINVLAFYRAIAFIIFIFLYGFAKVLASNFPDPI